MSAPKNRDGSTYDTAMLVTRESLDLSGLRKHCKADHRVPVGRGWPRSNLDLAAVHARMHHRFPSHAHGGPWVLILRPGSRSTVGQIPRPLGWFTGQEARRATGGTVKLCADCIAHDCGSRDELRGCRVIHTSPRRCECVCDHGFETVVKSGPDPDLLPYLVTETTDPEGNVTREGPVRDV